MRGTILGLSDGRGVLIASDERRLDFPLSEWRSAGAPVAGQIVDFVEEGGQARSVFLVPSGATHAAAGSSSSSAFVLSIIALGCLVLGLVVPFVPTVAALVLGLIGANQARGENNDNALIMARIAWIGATVLLLVGFLMLGALIMLFGGLAAFSLDLGVLDHF
jgi:hypothetical protein